MKPEDLQKLASKLPLSEATMKRNAETVQAHVVKEMLTEARIKHAKRIRQSTKPIMNKWEQEWFNKISSQFLHVRAQSKRYKLGNGAWFKVDITGIDPDTKQETAWEVKGPSKMKGVAKGLLTLKFAAAAWPEVAFYLVWKESGEWKTQRVLS